MNYALRIENLCFSYSGGSPGFPKGVRDIIAGANLDLRQGETLCISGASGQGKTVLLRLIAGLVKPKSGNLFYFGEYLPPEKFTLLEVSRRGVSLVFENGALISNLTVRENINLSLQYHHYGTPEEIEAKVNMALDLMRVRGQADQYPSTLSVGMRKRVAIARAWAMDPKLLLMDEPTLGLDNSNRRGLLPLIDNMRMLFKTSILMVTHDLYIADELKCDVCFLHDKIISPPHSFDYWLKSDEDFARSLFRDIQNRYST